MSDTRRMTPDELTTAAAALAPSGTPRAPLPVADVLDHLAYELRDRLADLWTLRAAADAELTGHPHAAAVETVATMAGHYADALDAARTLADQLGHTLGPDATGRAW